MRIVFFGTSAFAVPSLRCLVQQQHHIVLCVTQPDRPQGRGLTPLPSPVKSAALRMGLPLSQPSEVGAIVTDCHHVKPEVGVVIAYGRLLPTQLLTIPVHGILGVHPSLLPKYRGASPMAWALLQGERTTGVTVFRLNERMDAGDVVLQQSVAIESRETAEELSGRLAALGADLLCDAVTRLERRQATFHLQDEALATSTPKLTKAHGRIDWQADAASIDRLVRALNPWPGTYTDWQGQRLKVWRVQPAPNREGTRGRPGEILSASSEGVVVATGEGTLVIHELQVAGSRRMTVREFLAGHALTVGELLGSPHA